MSAAAHFELSERYDTIRVRGNRKLVKPLIQKFTYFGDAITEMICEPLALKDVFTSDKTNI